MRGEPHYLAFVRIVGEIVNYYSDPNVQISIVCDDEQLYSPKCYAILNKIRQEHSEYRRKIVSLCFADDEYFVPLQAADMLAYLERREAERQFTGMTDHQFGCLFDQIVSSPRAIGRPFLEVSLERRSY